MTIRPAEVDLFHVDGQMDRHNKGNSQVSQFGNTPKSVAQWGNSFRRVCK